MRRNLFTGEDDLHAAHPAIAAHLEKAAVYISDAHLCAAGSAEWAECLVRAEREALAANAAMAAVLGPGTDTAALLVLVRLLVESMAHTWRGTET